MPFSTKMRSSYSKVTRLIQSNNNGFLTVHKYEESNVDFNISLNCCKLGNCVISQTIVNQNNCNTFLHFIILTTISVAYTKLAD